MSRALSLRLWLNDNKCYLAKRMLKLKLLICIYDSASTRPHGSRSGLHIFTNFSLNGQSNNC